MLRRLRIIPIFFLLLGLNGCTDLLDYISYKGIRNREQRFQIIVPRKWNVREGRGRTILIVSIPPTDKNKSEEFRSNFTVTVTDLPQDIPLNVYFEANQAELENVMPKAFDYDEGQVFTGLTQRGQWLSFTSEIDDVPIRIISAVWIKNKKAYVLTFLTTLENLPRLNPYFQKIIKTFRIL